MCRTRNRAVDRERLPLSFCAICVRLPSWGMSSRDRELPKRRFVSPAFSQLQQSGHERMNGTFGLDRKERHRCPVERPIRGRI